MRNIFVCTIGKSLLTNIYRLKDNDPLKAFKIKGSLIGLSKEFVKRDSEDKI